MGRSLRVKTVFIFFDIVKGFGNNRQSRWANYKTHTGKMTWWRNLIYVKKKRVRRSKSLKVKRKSPDASARRFFNHKPGVHTRPQVMAFVCRGCEKQLHLKKDPIRIVFDEKESDLVAGGEGVTRRVIRDDNGGRRL